MTAPGIVTREMRDASDGETVATLCVVCHGTFGHADVAHEEIVTLAGDTMGPAHIECTTCCDHCEDVVPDWRSQYIRGRHGHDMRYCELCTAHHAWRCAFCDETFDDDVDRFSVDDRAACERCFTDQEEEREARVIGPYHSHERRAAIRPMADDWTRRHGNRYIGVELEVERADDADDAVAIAGELLNAANTGAPYQRMYAERDGSLHDGFELITQPMGLHAHADAWGALLAHPAARMLRSHDTSTCGLHVHVSRAGLTRLQIAKAVVFLNDWRNEQFIRAIARRYNTNYCVRKNKRIGASPESHDRYEMLNLTNSRTVEFRIFRGTMRHETLMACVEFSSALLDWARDASCADLTDASFLRYVYDAKNRDDTKHLRQYLARRVTQRMAPRYTELRAMLTDITGTTPAAPSADNTNVSWGEL